MRGPLSAPVLCEALSQLVPDPCGGATCPSPPSTSPRVLLLVKAPQPDVCIPPCCCLLVGERPFQYNLAHVPGPCWALPPASCTCQTSADGHCPGDTCKSQSRIPEVASGHMGPAMPVHAQGHGGTSERTSSLVLPLTSPLRFPFYNQLQSNESGCQLAVRALITQDCCPGAVLQKIHS